MSNKLESRNFFVLIALAVVIVVGAACGSSPNSELRGAVSPTETSQIVRETEKETVDEHFEAPTKDEHQETAIEETPTTDEPQETASEETPTRDEPQETAAEETPTPLPPVLPSTSIPEPEPIHITNQGFGQDQETGAVSYGFIVSNPNKNLLFERSYAIINFLDESELL